MGEDVYIKSTTSLNSKTVDFTAAFIAMMLEFALRTIFLPRLVLSVKELVMES